MAEEKKTIQIYSTPSTPGREVTPFWRDKYEKDAKKYWDIFYKRHQDRFFKDRHYLDKEWGLYFDRPDCERLVVLEVGCGAGNTVFPLVSTYANIFVHACDFSSRAIGLVKAHKDYTNDRVNAFVCDITANDICQTISPFSVDVVTMVFVLSAVSPEKMSLVLHNIRRILKPNGRVLLRDYAAGDLAEERFIQKDQKISDGFYVRGDGTRAFYFSIDFLTNLFARNGFNAEKVEICCKQVENRSLELVMNRRWIQAVFTFDVSDTKPVDYLAAGRMTGIDILDTKQVYCVAAESMSDKDKRHNIKKDRVENFEIDLSDSITQLFGDSLSIEVIEIKLKDVSFRIKCLDKQHQHTCKSTGLMLWESARFMSMLLAENLSIVAGKNVLELGSGSAGICSMVAAQSAKFVVPTDGDARALELLKDNVASNLESMFADKVNIELLEWGNKLHIDSVRDLVTGREGFDIIIGTDVTYNPSAVIPLFETARQLVCDAVAEAAKPALVLCHIQRRVDEDSIISAASQFGFRLVDRLVFGKSYSGGIINSWISEGSSLHCLLQNTPINIMYFEI